MLKKGEPPEIDETNPFKNDKLGRSSFALPLTTLLSGASTPYVIALDGAWGTGKTTFLKMWRAHLERRGFITLEFNAWESDYTSDPVVAFIGEIEEAIES